MTISGVTVAATATYNNLHIWESRYGVADYPDGLQTPGLVTNVAITNMWDGTMDGAITLTRAGAYILDITVDGSSVSNAPHYFLYISPGSIHPANCVTAEVPSFVFAGFENSFLI